MLTTSSISPNKNNSKTQRSKTASNLYRKSKKITENQLAIEETKKLYQKYYENPNPLFISQLKTENLNIYLNNYKFNDMTVMCKILNKYKFFRSITLAPFDPLKKNPNTTRRNEREPITEGEKVKLAKEKRDKEIENMHMINKITSGIGKHLMLAENLFALNIINFNIDRQFASNLSKGIIGNHSLHALTINNCKMTIETYEILVKGLLNHEKIEYLDLRNNDIGDKYGNMIGRIIARQTYRRDQVIWLYGLRNEFPADNDYIIGLISLNLDGNKLSSYAADCITTSLASDQYVRSIILTNNEFDKNSCKKFIYMLRRNMTLLNIDLRNNPGYDDNIKTRLVMKMSKNIRNLYIQYKNKVFSEFEFENFKRFIDTSFFDLDIPEEIVELYNNNLQKISEASLNNNLNINNKLLKESNLNNKNVINKAMSDIQEEDKEYTNSNVSKNSLSALTPNSKNKIVKNYSKNNNSSEKENKKLMQENLLLKKKILELKAENLQKKLGKNLNVPNEYNMDNLNQNYKAADELFDKLNEIMETIGNDKNNNNKSKTNKNVVKKEEKNDKENKPKVEDKKIEEKKEDIKDNKKNDVEEDKKEIIEKKKDNKEELKEKKNEKEIKEDDKKEKATKYNNVLLYNEGEEGDGENNLDEDDLENLNEDEIRILQHQHLYEQLKKQYEEKGQKFDIEDYMEWYQQLVEQNGDEGEEDI